MKRVLAYYYLLHQLKKAQAAEVLLTPPSSKNVQVRSRLGATTTGARPHLTSVIATDQLTSTGLADQVSVEATVKPGGSSAQSLIFDPTGTTISLESDLATLGSFMDAAAFGRAYRACVVRRSTNNDKQTAAALEGGSSDADESGPLVAGFRVDLDRRTSTKYVGAAPNDSDASASVDDDPGNPRQLPFGAAWLNHFPPPDDVDYQRTLSDNLLAANCTDVFFKFDCRFSECRIVPFAVKLFRSLPPSTLKQTDATTVAAIAQAQAAAVDRFPMSGEKRVTQFLDVDASTTTTSGSKHDQMSPSAHDIPHLTRPAAESPPDTLGGLDTSDGVDTVGGADGVDTRGGTPRTTDEATSAAPGGTTTAVLATSGVPGAAGSGAASAPLEAAMAEEGVKPNLRGAAPEFGRDPIMLGRLPFKLNIRDPEPVLDPSEAVSWLSLGPVTSLFGSVTGAVQGFWSPVADVFSHFIRQPPQIGALLQPGGLLDRRATDNMDDTVTGSVYPILFQRPNGTDARNGPSHGPARRQLGVEEDSSIVDHGGAAGAIDGVPEPAAGSETDAERVPPPSSAAAGAPGSAVVQAATAADLATPAARSPAAATGTGAVPNRPVIVSGSVVLDPSGAVQENVGSHREEVLAEIMKAEEATAPQVVEPPTILKYPHLNLVAPYRDNPYATPEANRNAMAATLSALLGDLESVPPLPTLQPPPLNVVSMDPVDPLEDWLRRVKLPPNVRATTSSLDVFKALSDKSTEVITNTMNYPARVLTLALENVLMKPLGELLKIPTPQLTPSSANSLLDPGPQHETSLLRPNPPPAAPVAAPNLNLLDLGEKKLLDLVVEVPADFGEQEAPDSGSGESAAKAQSKGAKLASSGGARGFAAAAGAAAVPVKGLAAAERGKGVASGLPILSPPPIIAQPLVFAEDREFLRDVGGVLGSLTTTDMLPWLPLDAIAAGLPSWFSEAMMGSYSSLLTDLVRVAEQGLLGLQMVVDAIGETPIPLTPSDMSEMVEDIADAFRLSPAGQEADALKSMAVTIRGLPIPMSNNGYSSNSLKKLLEPFGDFPNWPDNLAEYLRDASNLLLDPAAPGGAVGVLRRLLEARGTAPPRQLSAEGYPSTQFNHGHRDRIARVHFEPVQQMDDRAAARGRDFDSEPGAVHLEGSDFNVVQDDSAAWNDEPVLDDDPLGEVALMMVLPATPWPDGVVWSGVLEFGPLVAGQWRNLTSADAPTTSDNLPWLPLDGVLGGLPGFFVGKLGKAGQVIEKAAGVWQKGSIGLDKYAGGAIMDNVPGIDQKANLTLGKTDGYVKNVNQPGEQITMDKNQYQISGGGGEESTRTRPSNNSARPGYGSDSPRYGSDSPPSFGYPSYDSVRPGYGPAGSSGYDSSSPHIDRYGPSQLGSNYGGDRTSRAPQYIGNSPTAYPGSRNDYGSNSRNEYSSRSRRAEFEPTFRSDKYSSPARMSSAQPDYLAGEEERLGGNSYTYGHEGGRDRFPGDTSETSTGFLGVDTNPAILYGNHIISELYGGGANLNADPIHFNYGFNSLDPPTAPDAPSLKIHPSRSHREQSKRLENPRNQAKRLQNLQGHIRSRQSVTPGTDALSAASVMSQHATHEQPRQHQRGPSAAGSRRPVLDTEDIDESASKSFASYDDRAESMGLWQRWFGRGSSAEHEKLADHDYGRPGDYGQPSDHHRGGSADQPNLYRPEDDPRKSDSRDSSRYRPSLDWARQGSPPTGEMRRADENTFGERGSPPNDRLRSGYGEGGDQRYPPERRQQFPHEYPPTGKQQPPHQQWERREECDSRITAPRSRYHGHDPSNPFGSYRPGQDPRKDALEHQQRMAWHQAMMAMDRYIRSRASGRVAPNRRYYDSLDELENSPLFRS